MGQISIGDIIIRPLKRISVDGGDVLHVLKSSDEEYCGYGESYFSLVTKGWVKAWKRHTRMTMNLVVPSGMVRFVFFDEASGGFREERIGVDRYARLTVPPGIWFGFQGLHERESLVLNITNLPHDPGEVDRKPVSEITYEW